nr:uncharacterized protein CTRU02_10756 [Colletotrichum truncatum]KAF6786632.1 hypothetical protein CTRU02_10756 [Colletotrichum truncatum]
MFVTNDSCLSLCPAVDVLYCGKRQRRTSVEFVLRTKLFSSSLARSVPRLWLCFLPCVTHLNVGDSRFVCDRVFLDRRTRATGGDGGSPYAELMCLFQKSPLLGFFYVVLNQQQVAAWATLYYIHLDKALGQIEAAKEGLVCGM